MYVVTGFSKLFNLLSLENERIIANLKISSVIESEYRSVLNCTEDSWSRGPMSKRLFNMKSETELFLKIMGKSFLRLSDHDWMCNIVFCIAIIQHMPYDTHDFNTLILCKLLLSPHSEYNDTV
jgi:hypothetical protein